MPNSKELIRELTHIGLSEKESAVYLALTALGSGTAYRIAEVCDVKKPTVYIILEELRNKGLVLKIPHVKKALYSARNIEDYLLEQERRIKSVRSIVPLLDSMNGNSGANVFFFNGPGGLRQATNYKIDLMKGKEFCGFYSNLADAPSELIDFYRTWDRESVAKGISFRIIMAKRGAGRYYKDILELSKETKQVYIRLLDEFPYPENQTIDMGEDFLRIVDEKRMHATIIDDRMTAGAMRQIFNVVWERGI